MTREEKKSYIKKTWDISSGQRIAEMLKRYFKDETTPPRYSKPATIQDAKRIFQVT